MTEHVSFEGLADYLADLLEEPESNELEAHLFACEACASECERLVGIAAAVRDSVPPVISPEQFEALAREGRIAAENRMSPGQVAEVRYPPEGKLLVHRLGGFDLRRAHRVDVELVDLEGGILTRMNDVPFDAARGEVLIACQRHFANSYPDDASFRVEAITGDEREEVKRYTVLHRM
jgi:hypothetical protein